MLKILRLHSLLNRYDVVDLRAGESLSTDGMAALTVRRCEGGEIDGVAFIVSLEGDIAQVRVFNPSGSESELCVNGIRCAGYALMRELDRDRIVVRNAQGDFALERVGELADGVEGIAITLPFVPYDGLSRKFLVREEGEREFFDWEMGPYLPMELGIPHLVALDNPVSDAKLARIAGPLQNDPRFPTGINLSIAIPLGPDEFFLRTYERGGAGLSCSCASAMLCSTAALIHMEIFEPNRPIRCVTLGGAGQVTVREDSMTLVANVSLIETQTGETKVESPEASAYELYREAVFAEVGVAAVLNVVRSEPSE